ncbi:glycosyltransferase family 39 protein [Tunturibacter empetritectus]|uniref:glycosyltransferase family 39 protein n=1 Tax=Tunturiibacter empetritectus TaxID=3069691 RepID=UPI0033409A6F
MDRLAPPAHHRTSLWALRLLPALAGAATILLAGLLARELGGRRWAMFLASLAALMAPVSLALSHLFTMNAFDPLLWAAIAYLVVRIAKTGNEPLWLAVGALAGATILNKYAVIFWLSGLIIGVCLTPLRQSLRHRWFWFGCALAAAIALPNFLWQWQHHFPFLQLMPMSERVAATFFSPRCLFSRPRHRCLALSPRCSYPLRFCSSSPGRAARIAPSDGPTSYFSPK